jgi:hypothetical protein
MPGPRAAGRLQPQVEPLPQTGKDWRKASARLSGSGTETILQKPHN